jgi:hypothetical protein
MKLIASHNLERDLANQISRFRIMLYLFDVTSIFQTMWIVGDVSWSGPVILSGKSCILHTI